VIKENPAASAISKGEAAMKLKRVDHLAFVVTDLERSVKFYREVFDGEVGRSRGFNEQDKAAKRSQHILVKVGNFAFDLFQMVPGDPPKTDTRHLHSYVD
jgi:catechol 2,3-dioxygenase-like lactoylglutathione lyase family enzyme